jgi:hypothetical protein
MALMTRTSLLVMLVMSGACTRAADRCLGDVDCTDPAYPYCDVNGTYPASGGDMGVCTIPPPADAGIDAPFSCTPGGATCTNNMLTVCNSDGVTMTTSSCLLGCETDGTACKSFEPSNGLGPAFVASATGSDIVFPSAITIDSDTGGIVDSANVPINITSVVVTQSGAPSIRVFIAHSFDITNAQATGSAAIAFVAATTVNIDGIVSLDATGTASGPGALVGATAGVAGAGGGGGGGNATVGGGGASDASAGGVAAGGAAQIAFSPLGGGGVGGGDGTNAVGGGAGGAIQIDAGTSVTVTGTLSLGGGAGGPLGGGGAGGTVVLESPTVNIAGMVAANGASGGACGVDGNNATRNTTPAPSVSGCSYQAGMHQAIGTSGSGGTAGVAPGGGSAGLMGGPAGGGSVGRMSITTADGTYQHESATISAAVSTGTLTIK